MDIDFLKDIEKKYDVQQIKCNQIPIWAVLRIYLFDSVQTNKKVSINRYIFIHLLKSLFYYNPLLFFRKSDVWIFSSSGERVLYGNKYINRIFGGIVSCVRHSLTIETPVNRNHCPKSKITEKRIVSMSILYLFTYIFSLFIKNKKYKIEREDILQNILQDYSLKFDYNVIINRLLAQYFSLKLLLKIFPEPKLVFMNCPYTLMGYVYAFKKRKIKVVEMQHGVVNDKHYAYNSLIVNRDLLPDYFVVYGNYERHIFETNNKCYVSIDKIILAGSYILDLYKTKTVTDIFEMFRKKYKKIIVVSGQDFYEQLIIDFINDVAQVDVKNYYVYIPRKNKNCLHLANNVGYCSHINIYDAIKCADIHSTINSTTCKESHYLGVKNVFIDIDGLSKLYYGDVFKEGIDAYYARTPAQYISCIGQIYKLFIGDTNYFYIEGHLERIKKFINSNI